MLAKNLNVVENDVILSAGKIHEEFQFDEILNTVNKISPDNMNIFFGGTLSDFIVTKEIENINITIPTNAREIYTNKLNYFDEKRNMYYD